MPGLAKPGLHGSWKTFGSHAAEMGDVVWLTFQKVLSTGFGHSKEGKKEIGRLAMT